MSKLVFFGECMAEFRRAEGDLWRQDFAGDTYNTAVYLARLDTAHAHTIEYACGIGDDPFASAMLAAWSREGISSHYVRTVTGRPTGLYTIAVDALGERQFAYWRDTSAARAYFDCAGPTPLEQHVHEINCLYLSGISLAILPEQGLRRLFALCDAVRAHGGQVVFDNNFRPRLWPSTPQAAQAYQACLERTDVALLTLDDQAALWGTVPDDDLIAKCFTLPPKEIVIKQGSAPTLIKLVGQAPAQAPVERVAPVDTTAAGDSFAAAYLFARLRGTPPVAAATLGNALAARVIQHPGALMPRDALSADAAFWHLLGH